MFREKISPAFGPFLAKAAPNDKLDAIVIYKYSPPARGGRIHVRGRLRELRKRLDFVRERAQAQRPVQKAIAENYARENRRRFSINDPLEFTPIGTSSIPAASIEVTRQTLRSLAEQPDVVAILPNQKIGLIQPKQIDYMKLKKQEVDDSLTWGLKYLSIPDLWKTTKGRDINVAVLDTGVHGEHEALKGKVKGFVVIDPLGNQITASRTFDGGKHGTHVCGTIAGGRTTAGIQIGVAPDANLYVAAVLVGESTLRTVLEGISWAIEQGADVINMSLGFSYYEPKFAEVFRVLVEHYDVLPVVAIGNESHGNSCSPGNAPNAFSIGALEKMSGGGYDVAAFSCGASLVFPGDRLNALVSKPDVVAPGVQVYSCIPPEKRLDGDYSYSYMDGTSMAAPHVSGVAALLMSARPEATVTSIIAALKNSAKHPRGAEFRPDNRWGYGVIKPANALLELG